MSALVKRARESEFSQVRFFLIPVCLMAAMVLARTIALGGGQRAILLVGAMGGLILAVVRPFEFLLLFLALMPFEQVTMEPFGTLPRLVGLLMAPSLVLTYWQRRYLNWKLKDWLLLAWIVVVWLSVPLAKNRDTAVVAAFSLTQLFALYLAFSIFVDSTQRMQRALVVLAVSAAISTLAPPIAQMTGIGLEWVHFEGQTLGADLTGYRYGGAYGDSSEFAAFLCVLLPFVSLRLTQARTRQGRVAWLAVVAILTMGFFGTLARAGGVGLLVVFGVLITLEQERKARDGKRQRIWRAMVIVVILVAAFLSLTGDFDQCLARITMSKPSTLDENIIYRIESIRTGLRVFASNPLLGIGVRQFREVKGDYGFYIPGSHGPAHNMYVEVLTGLGLLGFVPFLAILALNWHNLRKGFRNAQHLPPELRNISLVLLGGYLGFLATAWVTNSETKKVFWILLACGTVVSNLVRSADSQAMTS